MKKFVPLMLSAVLAACSAKSPPTPPPIHDVSELRQALEAAGVSIEELDSSAPPVSGAEVSSWRVRGEVVHIFVFSDRAARDSGAETLVSVEAPDAAAGQEIQLWAHEDFVVVYPGTDGGTVLLISALLGDPQTQEVAGPDEPYPPAVSAAQQELALDLNVSPAVITVLEYTPVTWPDSCLGLAGKQEICALAETPGWKIEMRVNGEVYTVRADSFGNTLRLEE